MDTFWDSVLSIGKGASGASGASYMLQQNSRGWYSPIGGRDIQHNGVNAPLAPLMPLGADPYDAEERLAIQQEGREISSLPDKPIFSLAEQAALVLDGYNGDREQAAADLRVVARNFALADYVEAGIVPLESPQPSLAESTTPMTPDRGFDDVPGFDGMPDLTAEQHGVIQRRLMGIDAPQPARVQPAPSMPPQSALRHSGPMIPVLEKDRHGETVVRGFRLATQQPVRPSAPATITCSSCAEFEPGPEHNSLGRCSRTADGLPPIASRGYGACFPHAPRTCPDHKESLK